MKFFGRVLVVAWALTSVGVGGLAFAAVTGTGGNASAASQEAFETIPEAIMQVMGFEGAPLVMVGTYWLALAAAIYFAFKPRRPI